MLLILTQMGLVSFIPWWNGLVRTQPLLVWNWAIKTELWLAGLLKAHVYIFTFIWQKRDELTRRVTNKLVFNDNLLLFVNYVKFFACVILFINYDLLKESRITDVNEM